MFVSVSESDANDFEGFRGHAKRQFSHFFRSKFSSEVQQEEEEERSGNREETKQSQTRKRKQTLVIPKNSSDARYMTIIWTKLLKKQFLSALNPLELFDNIKNDPYMWAVQGKRNSLFMTIPIRYLRGIRADTKEPVSLKLYGIYNADHMWICENECRFFNYFSNKSKMDNCFKKYLIQHYGSHYIGNSVWIETEQHYGTLATLLQKQQTGSCMDETCVAAICKQVLESLILLHSNNIVHRDVRPSSIWITNNPYSIPLDKARTRGNSNPLKLSSSDEHDGWVLLERKSSSSSSSSKDSGSICGNFTFKLGNFASCYEFQPQENGKIRDVSNLVLTEMDCLHWLAPEMIAGEDEVVEYDTKCDVWSFGLLVWSMLNHGRSPLADMKTAEEIASAIMSPSFQPRLSDFDNDYSLLVDDFLGKCLRRDPAKRWSCQELLKHDFITSRTSGDRKSVV